MRFLVRPGPSISVAAGAFPSEDVLVLEVDSWVTPETVADAYGRLQRLVLGGRSRAHTKSLEIVRLAVAMMKPGEPLPSAEDVMKKWNRSQPSKYKHLWRFRDDYARALRQILYPGRSSRAKRLKSTEA
jgi:hypothetical protein